MQYTQLGERGPRVSRIAFGNWSAGGDWGSVDRAAAIAATREALLIEGQAEPSEFPGLTQREQMVLSALSVPLISRDKLFGVLNVNAGPDRSYTVYDLQAASLFAEQAAGAISNARLYETERMHAQRAELAKEFLE